MKIGTSHRNKIWSALLEWRQQATAANNDLSQTLQQSISLPSSDSLLSSQSSLSQQSSYCPGFYEVTRYTFKQTISLTHDDERPSLRKKSSVWDE